MLEFILERANYWAIISLMMIGLYITFQSANMIKKLVGLSVFQTSVFLFYITLGKVAGGTAPILFGRDVEGHGDGHGDVGVHGAGEATIGQTVPAANQAGHEAVAIEEIADTEIASVETGHSGESVVDPELAHSFSLPEGGGNPITGLQEVYSNPLPHVLILTAIVVGVATLSVGLALVVRIREAYGSIEFDEVRQMDIVIADAQDADDVAEAAG